MLSKVFRKSIVRAPHRNFNAMTSEVKQHLQRLGITNKNIVYNPR